MLGPDNRLYGARRAARDCPKVSVAIYRFDPGDRCAYDVLHALPPSNSVDGRARPAPRARRRQPLRRHRAAAPERMGVVSTLFRLAPEMGAASSTSRCATSIRRSTGVAVRRRAHPGRRRPDLRLRQAGGAAGTGTFFRSIRRGGPPSDPLAFTVLHTFPADARPEPRRRSRPADGLLYGTTSHGGADPARRRLSPDPSTGAVTVRASIPGTPPGTWRTANRR